MNYKKINNITGWLMFLISAIVYLLTIEPTASFWDCGEFIATAYKLEVGHPPGASLFMLIARVFSFFAGSDVSQVAKWVNIFSALTSAFTILFLFWTITHFAKKLVSKAGEFNTAKLTAIMGSGIVGSLAYTFSDTFWFSAVEGEVYALSSFFTAIVFWAMLKWEDNAEKKYSAKWIILIAYLMGLSTGIHLLNLLAIPAMVLIFYFNKYKTTTKGVIYALLISGAILMIILKGIIPGVLIVGTWFELLFVNTIGLPFNSGLVIYFLLLTGIIVYGVYYSIKKAKPVLNTAILCFTVILIGYSSIAIIPIRSSANTPMNENDPDNVFSLISYVNREAYGNRPLLHGEYYNAPYVTVDSKPIYEKQDGKYKIIDHKIKRKFDKEFKTIFPRMYSRMPEHIQEYNKWANIKGKPVRVINQQNEQETIYRPTFVENLRYFTKYQIGHMYFRYFFWNFAGRQNNIQGHGEVLNGNWLSGIKFIDAARLGPQDNLPDVITDNKGYNRYYFLPLLLGLIGAVFFYKRDRKNFWVILSLFVLTGIAIIVYLNEVPITPRERDYVYAGSFYAFAIYIGIGVMALTELLKKIAKPLLGAGTAVAISLILVPGILALENWDDHDRSNRTSAVDFASNYLNTCAPNAIIFTNGDNDTFPLWYAQEVEGIRTDVRVVCLPFLPHSWYLDQLKRSNYESAPVPFSLTRDKYGTGKREFLPIIPRKDEYYSLKKIIDFVALDDSDSKMRYGTELIDYIPRNKFIVPVDSAAVIQNGTIPSERINDMVSPLKWTLEDRFITKDQLLILDIIATNNWERPIYYTAPGKNTILGLPNYFQHEGLAFRLIPARSEGNKIGQINTRIMYDNMMNKYKYGGITKKNTYFEETSERMFHNLKNTFGYLATALVEENKPDSAKMVLDRIYDLFSYDVKPYDHLDLANIKSYYEVGDSIKAVEISEKLFERTCKNMDYYLSLPKKLIASVDQNIQIDLGVILAGDLLELGEFYGNTSLVERIREKINLYYNKYVNIQSK